MKKQSTITKKSTRLSDSNNVDWQHFIYGDIVDLSDLPEKYLTKEVFLQLIDYLNDHTQITTIEHHNEKNANRVALLLFKVLEKNRTLTTLDFHCYNRTPHTDNNIGNKAIKLLAASIKKHPSLTKIDLHKHLISAKGAKFLFNAIAENNALRELDLSENAIKGIMKYLENVFAKNQTLTKLNLGNNDINYKRHVAKQLAQGLKKNNSLTVIDLTHSLIKFHAFLLLLNASGKRNIPFKLILNHNYGILKECKQTLCDAITDNNSLTALELGNCHIYPREAKFLFKGLTKNRSLTVLKLNSNKLIDRDAEHLSEAMILNKTLTHLDLRDNAIGDEGTVYLADAIKEQTVLTNFNFDFNLIGGKGTKSFSNVLKNNQVLTSLTLRVSLVGYDIIKDLARAIEKNKTLTTFKLIGSGIGCEFNLLIKSEIKKKRKNECIKYLINALIKNQKIITLFLSINGNPDALDTEVKKYMTKLIIKNKLLTTLNFSHMLLSAEPMDCFLKALEKNHTLTTFGLTDSKINDKEVSALANVLATHRSLTKINLYGNLISDKGAQYLLDATRKNRKITEVNLFKKTGAFYSAGKISKTMMSKMTNQLRENGYLLKTIPSMAMTLSLMLKHSVWFHKNDNAIKNAKSLRKNLTKKIVGYAYDIEVTEVERFLSH